MVTLKGQVKTDEEKKAIEDKAASVAGADKVTSELTVGANTSKKS
jgi:osmotically-inducible protein OsmY